MKKTTFILYIFSIVYQTIFSQVASSNLYYWYKIDLAILRESLSFKPYYQITKVWPDVLSGNEKDYVKYQKKQMKTGSIVIGPFSDKESAVFSSSYYQNSVQNTGKFNVEQKGEYYWYSHHINKTLKNNAFVFGDSRWGILEGPLNEFDGSFNEGNMMLLFTIGPFRDKKSVELSKQLNCQLVPKHIRQKNYVDYKTYFWFSMQVDNISDPVYKKPVYKISNVSAKTEHGNGSTFVKSFLKGLDNKQLTMGPYQEINDAELSRETYAILPGSNNLDSTVKLMESKYNTGDNGYFNYFSKFVTNKAGNKFFVERTATETLTYKEFCESLVEGLNIELFMNGLFDTRESVEDSKRLQRFLGGKKTYLFHPKRKARVAISHEYISPKIKYPFNIKSKLKKMAAKFPSTFATCSVKIDSIPGKGFLNLEFNIPPQCFNTHSMMVAHPIIVYKDSLYTLQSYTYQGEKVQDNNPVISISKAKKLNLKDRWGFQLKEGYIPEKVIISTTFSAGNHRIKAKDIEILWKDVIKY